MDIIQTFYDTLACEYDKLFSDWHAAMREQAAMLDRLFAAEGFDRSAQILDCACGIGTQAIGLALLGYPVTASDISDGELAEAKKRAEANGAALCFARADFRALQQVFSAPFDIVLCMDNALPHMLTRDDLAAAVKSIASQTKSGGIFAASIRDYDALLETKPPYSPPYIHKTDEGQRVSFQTWDWDGELYKLTQYILDDAQTLRASKFDCVYRATRRAELTELLSASGWREVTWKFPEETGFYQPIVIAKK